MILKALEILGALHMWRISRRTEEISRDLQAVNHGTLDPLLLKLETEGSPGSEWRAPENTRRARFYRLREWHAETHEWERTAAIIGRSFKVTADNFV